MPSAEAPGGTVPAAIGRRMGRGGFVAAVVLCLAGIAILLGLGTWQVERLGWKTALIATIDARVHSEPLPLAEVERVFAETGDVDYMPVRLTGRFLHTDERHFLSTFEGQAGWNVYTPLRLADGRTVFVNRGFVPYDRKAPESRAAGQAQGKVEISGIARNGETARPSSFIPDNDPVKNVFFWKSLPDLARALPSADVAGLLPFLVDAGPGASSSDGPVGGTTVVDIPNSHLEYAITWYGLALVLAVMLVLLVVGRLRKGSAA